MLRLSIIFILFFIFPETVQAQVNFQITNYSFEEIGASNQNWDIVSDGSERILVANNLGLLILENSDVKFLQLPQKTIFRSVAYINNRIYTGSFEDFGYWEEDKDSGSLSYTSLAALLQNPDMNNDEIWKIVEHKNIIYFHSFGSIYAYNGSEVFRVEKEGAFMFPYMVQNKIFIQRVQDQLFTLNEGEFFPVTGSNFLRNEEVKSIVELPGNKILIGTSEGLYTYDGLSFSNWGGEQSSDVVKNNINTVIRAGNKIVIGTILNGLYIYNLNFELIRQINTDNQLPNNTVLSLEKDPYGNIWVGMDNGLSYIAFDTPLNTYRDSFRDAGSVYTATLFNENLYVGTNQGIYKFNEAGETKKLLPESQGQVWFLKEFDGNLYAGLNDGTYVLKNDKLSKVSTTFGGYNLKPYERNNKKLLLQSSYSDLVVYEEENDLWKQSYIFSGFSTPAKFLEYDPTGNLWLGHTIRGIFRLQPNIQFDEIQNVDTVDTSYGLPTLSNRVFKLNNRILTSVEDSLYQWNEIETAFEPYTDLDEFFTEKGPVKNIIPVGNQKYWVLKNNEIILFEIHFDTIRVLYRILPNMYDFHLVEGYENIVPLSENLHLLCLEDGFSILNLDDTSGSKYPEKRVFLQSVSTTDTQENINTYTLINKDKIELPYSENSITFTWTSSQPVGNRAFFQYKLAGLENDWHKWGSETTSSYLRLPSGEYSFSIRSVGPKGLLTETETLLLVIKKPWYFSTGAFVVYAVLIISFVLMIRFYISRKRWKEIGNDLEKRHKKMARKREEAEKQIIELTNEKLQSEVEHKSAQLASNTMSIMRKNNLLSSIKDELEKQREKLGNKVPDRFYKKIYDLINNGIEDEHEWEVFEQLYDQAHGDFFKRFKEKYPQVTPSDLRLCAYLRMNLSSKEIAPLLNISVRGVEERRYRLRKRLDLSTDTNLNELIMTF